MNQIQKTSKLNELSVDFIVDRQVYSGTKVAPPAYSIGTTTFSNSGYFVPTWNPNAVDKPASGTTTVKFVPIVQNVTAEVYPIQCQWNFGEKDANTYFTLNAKTLSTAVGTLNESLIAANAAPATIRFTSSSITNWPNSGAFKIDNEIFSYSGKINSGNMVLNVRVAQYGTTRADHDTNSKAVLLSGNIPSQHYQYQSFQPAQNNMNLNSIYRVELVVIDNFYRKYVSSRMVYPKKDV